MRYVKLSSMVTSSYGSFFCVTGCEGNSPITGQFPSQRASDADFDVFDMGPLKLLNKQYNDRRYETTWRSCNVIVMICCDHAYVSWYNSCKVGFYTNVALITHGYIYIGAYICYIHSVVCVSNIVPILWVSFHVVYMQLAIFFYDDCENMCTLSY